MKSAYLATAFAALASGAALNANLVRRGPAPVSTPSVGCSPDPTFTDEGFAGNGSAWGITPTTGNLTYTSSFGGKYGLQADLGSNQGAFTFRVLSGTGSFQIYQNLCLAPNKAYGINWYTGMTAPPPGKPAGNTGCTVQLNLNDQPAESAKPICGDSNGVPATAPTNYAFCHQASYDNTTFYSRGGAFIQSPLAVNKIGWVFNCTQNVGGYNVQADFDYVTNNSIFVGHGP